jgi:purine-binding chemotaxis protein CheW
MNILAVSVAGERFGLPVTAVREILRAVALAPLPGAPPHVEGVLNARGELLAVFDLRARFGLPTRAIEPSDHLVVVRVGERVVALRVDEADELIEVEDQQLVPPASLSPSFRRVAGVAALPDGAVVIHDLSAFLSETEAETLDDALHAATLPTSQA